ncbi:MAG TPA: hypothetical protein VNB06_05820 [Thermoanaerobaculia bacterium]|nr:hypothetical protein [Thermoanaerobaculia bacterium]
MSFVQVAGGAGVVLEHQSGDALVRGDFLELEDGVSEVNEDSGVELYLRAQSAIDLETVLGVEVHHAHCVAAVRTVG